MREYRPRTAPARFFEGVPEIVKAKVAVINKTQSILEFDVIFKDTAGQGAEIIGLDFSRYGFRGQHFFLEPHECRAYRERNRRNRIAWVDLPEATQKAIVNYLQEE